MSSSVGFFRTEDQHLGIRVAEYPPNRVEVEQKTLGRSSEDVDADAHVTTDDVVHHVSLYLTCLGEPEQLDVVFYESLERVEQFSLPLRTQRRQNALALVLSWFLHVLTISGQAPAVHLMRVVPRRSQVMHDAQR